MRRSQDVVSRGRATCGMAKRSAAMPVETLLSTPPHGDAVTFGYRPENACLEGTSALLIEYAFRRTRARLFGGFPSQQAGTLVLPAPG